MEYRYTIDPEAEEPIMLIDRHIGFDSEDGYGIMGNEFSRELLVIDTLKKPRIHVWINSPGGVISDAEQIVAAILKSNTPVDTHNIGMAASCAGPIWLAGRNRYMMDYAKFMMHPVSGGTDPKLMKAFEDSTATMLSSRTGITEDTIRRMMNETTWLNAEQCKQMFSCKVEPSSDYNKPRASATNSVEDWKGFKEVVNKLIEDKKQTHTEMKAVCNRLNLNESATEGAILSEIDKISNRAQTAENKLLTQEAENKAKIEVLNKQLAESETRATNAEAKVKEITDREASEKATKLKAEVKEVVANYVKAGKIENNADVIEKAEKMAASDLESFKTLYGAVAVNKSMPGKLDVKTVGGQAGGYSAESIMVELAVQNKQI